VARHPFSHDASFQKPPKDFENAMKRLICDLDDTISVTMQGDYPNARPNKALIERLREYKSLGYEIVINTSRSVRTFEGNIGKINLHTLPVVLEWLKRHQIPHDEVIVGKPWCGTEGFYVDDKAIRPSEFVAMSREQIRALLDREAAFRVEDDRD
jgi:capsule biosynthesis phosphatase